MEFVAKLLKEKQYWVVELDEFGGPLTQGRTKNEAVFMLQDLFQEMIFDQLNKKIKLDEPRLINNEILLSVPDQYAVPLLLHELRYARGQTIEDVSHLCGFKSKNAYAQYEKGRRMPSIEQFSKLLEVLGAKLKVIF